MVLLLSHDQVRAGPLISTRRTPLSRVSRDGNAVRLNVLGSASKIAFDRLAGRGYASAKPDVDPPIEEETHGRIAS